MNHRWMTSVESIDRLIVVSTGTTSSLYEKTVAIVSLGVRVLEAPEPLLADHVDVERLGRVVGLGLARVAGHDDAEDEDRDRDRAQGRPDAPDHPASGGQAAGLRLHLAARAESANHERQAAISSKPRSTTTTSITQ